MNASARAARNAIAFFQDDFWKGPKPTEDTVLKVIVTDSEETYLVVVKRILTSLQR